MKNLSVFQVILLAAFGALAISGILVFALFVGIGKGNSVGQVIIWGTQDQGVFATVLRQAAENEGRLSQVSYIQKDPAAYEDQLTDALASATGPDLYILRQDYVVRNAGKIRPIPYNLLSQNLFQDTFLDAADPYLASGGSLGVPMIVDPLVMYWNKDILASAGFAQPPQYWDEFSDMAAKIVKKDDTGAIKKAAVALGEYQNIDHAKDIISLLILQAGGNITQKDNTGRLVPALSARTAGSQSQGTESAIRFYTEFADPSKVDYSWNRSLPSSRTAFSAGDLALYFGYASEANFLARSNPNLNFSMAAIPQIRGGPRSLNVAHVYALAVSRTSRNPDGARIAAGLIGDTSVARSLSIALGIPSARRDVVSEKRADSGSELAENQAIIARSWIDPDPVKTSDIFRDMIEGITSGSARISESIGRADQQIAQIIGQ